MPAKLFSRIPAITASLDPRVDVAIGQGAELIAESAKARVPDAPPIGEGLVAAIHTEHEDTSTYSVVAGDSDVFYGHMVEHGTSHSAPHPFLVPAAEEQKDHVVDLVQVVLRTL